MYTESEIHIGYIVHRLTHNHVTNTQKYMYTDTQKYTYTIMYTTQQM